ncbi:hypothetical protein KIN20_034003 [Parelaphostrongylus tenuis]|uniref:Uncharacterized protein n=1 Tax=Parelaphostrongylus tenuis TaxID=148309 RepID=A0AAD5R9M2_PARTN|nr:hypothetical protein KIN20_034003 [Parelaphostrongylus tenuis]
MSRANFEHVTEKIPNYNATRKVNLVVLHTRAKSADFSSDVLQQQAALLRTFFSCSRRRFDCLWPEDSETFEMSAMIVVYRVLNNCIVTNLVSSQQAKYGVRPSRFAALPKYWGPHDSFRINPGDQLLLSRFNGGVASRGKTGADSQRQRPTSKCRPRRRLRINCGPQVVNGAVYRKLFDTQCTESAPPAERILDAQEIVDFDKSMRKLRLNVSRLPKDRFSTGEQEAMKSNGFFRPRISGMMHHLDRYSSSTRATSDGKYAASGESYAGIEDPLFLTMVA